MFSAPDSDQEHAGLFAAAADYGLAARLHHVRTDEVASSRWEQGTFRWPQKEGSCARYRREELLLLLGGTPTLWVSIATPANLLPRQTW